MLSLYSFPAKNSKPSEVATLTDEVVKTRATKSYGTMVVLIH